IDYPPVRFAFVLRTCRVEELSSLIPADLTMVGDAAGRHIFGPPRVYYDAWQDSSGGDIWIGFPVSDDFTPSGEVRVEVIPSGRA
ncbi:hypothetical protein ABTM58_20595, partial [Acinetobacter baumannii]